EFATRHRRLRRPSRALLPCRGRWYRRTPCDTPGPEAQAAPPRRAGAGLGSSTLELPFGFVGRLHPAATHPVSAVAATRAQTLALENPSPARSHTSAASVTMAAPIPGESTPRRLRSGCSNAAGQPPPTTDRTTARARTIQRAEGAPKLPLGGDTPCRASGTVPARTATPGGTK